MQIFLTADESCSPHGPGAVEAYLHQDSPCIPVDYSGNSPGYTLYPQGGGPLFRRSVEGTNVSPGGQGSTEHTHSDPSTLMCKGFRVENQKEIDTPTVKISHTIP